MTLDKLKVVLGWGIAELIGQPNTKCFEYSGTGDIIADDRYERA
ncbi:MAG: hypothetical protein Q7S37_03350 [bacterium]|nr:hypothetical protein [bacterium]